MAIEPKGLRTHGKTTRTWEPPTYLGGFIKYEKSDEPWAAYCGLGRYVEVPLNLFDVRDEHMNLVGYTREDPVDNYRRGSRPLRVRIMEPLDGFMLSSLENTPPWDHRVDQTVRNVDVCTDTMHFSTDLCIKNFACWFCDLSDASALAEGGWLVCIGDDNRRAFARELARKAMRIHEDRLASGW
jgi:hypothetical protein